MCALWGPALCWTASLWPSRSMLCLLHPVRWPSRQVLYGPHQQSLPVAPGWVLLLVERWQETGGSRESESGEFVPLDPSLAESHQDGCVLDWKSQVLSDGLSTSFLSRRHWLLPPFACSSPVLATVTILCYSPTLCRHLKLPLFKVPSNSPVWTWLSLSSMTVIFLKSLIRYFVECCSVWACLVFFHSELAILLFGKDTLGVMYPSQCIVLVDTWFNMFYY